MLPVAKFKIGAITCAGSALCLLLLQGGCTNDANRTTTNASKAGMTDGDLERTINSRLTADAGMRDVKVSANADKNEVTLSGTVDSQAERTRALAAVKAVNPALVVTDKIDVKPREISRTDYTEEMAREHRTRAKGRGENVGDSVNDAWIHTKISAKLMTDKDTPSTKINVDVNNGVVTLRGNVDTAAAKSEAERIAKETDGVKRVMNRLKVGASS